MKSRFKPTRIALMFWTIFIGLGALWGGIAMFLSPDGSILRMEGLLPYPCGNTPVFRREMKAWLYILLVFDVFHDGLLRYHSCTPYIIRARPQCGQTAPQPIMALSKHMGRIPLHLVDYQLRGDGRGVPNTIECDMIKVCSSPFLTDSIRQPNSKAC